MKKFKNVKSKPKRIYRKSKPQQLPNNYRFIPERLSGDGFAFLVGVLFILASILVVGLDLYKNYQENVNLKAEKTKVNNDLKTWEKVVSQKPNYRDGYFKLAIIYYQLKDLDKAKENLDKAFELDPNFEKGRELESILENIN